MGELVNEEINGSFVHFRGLTGYIVENGMEFEVRNDSKEISEKAGPRASEWKQGLNCNSFWRSEEIQKLKNNKLDVRSMEEKRVKDF